LVRVFDYDAIGRDELLGMVQIPVSQILSEGQIDQWYQLGQNNASIHLVLTPPGNGTLPGQQLTSPISGSGGRGWKHQGGGLRVDLVSARDLVAPLNSDVYAVLNLAHKHDLSLLGMELKSASVNTTSPTWNQMFYFYVGSPEIDLLQIRLYDHGASATDLNLGTVEISLRDLQYGQSKEDWHQLRGTGAVRLILTPIEGPVSSQSQLTPQELQQTQQQQQQQQQQQTQQQQHGHLNQPAFILARLVEARNLYRGESNTKSDPYAVLSIRHKHGFNLFPESAPKYKSYVINNQPNPVWNQSFAIQAHNLQSDVLKVKMYDHDVGTFNERIGNVEIPLQQLLSATQPIDQWYNLQHGHGGAVRIVLSLLRETIQQQQMGTQQGSTPVQSQ